MKANKTTFGRLNARQLTSAEIVQVAGGVKVAVSSVTASLGLTGPDIAVQVDFS